MKVRRYTRGKTLKDYQADSLLRSAVERQLTVAGEALAQARRHYPEVDTLIGRTRDIVSVS